PTSARPAAVRLHVRQLLGEPFAMQKGPLVRAQLVRFDDRDHALVMKLHHLVTDGWSQRLFWEELEALYPALSGLAAANLPALPIEYRHFVRWQRAWLKSPAAEAQRSYWRARLGGLTELALRSDLPRPQRWTGRGARHRLQL